MNELKKGPHNPHRLLWWIAIIALGFSAAILYFLKPEGAVDISTRQLRVLIPSIGVLIAGVCLIAGTAERWFK